jgi:hypothetical protein
MILFIYLLKLIFCCGFEPMNQLSAGTVKKSDTLKIWSICADRISADPLGHFYILSGNSLVKYSPEGDSTYSWSEPITGPITMIDSGDPMRLLLYQKAFNLLRFLNNRLSPLIEPVRLDDLGLTTPLAFATSRQGGFWVLDGSTFRIKLVDKQLKTVLESKPLDLPPNPDRLIYRLIESGDHLFLHIPDQEIQVFDLFASLVKQVPLKSPGFNIYRNTIVLVFFDKITIWTDPVTPGETLYSHPGADIRDAFVFQNKLLIRTPDQVILMTR